METATTISLDPIGTSSIGGFGRCRYWRISAWLESKSPFAEFSSLITLWLEKLRSATWGALVLMIICKPTFGSNVISPMSSTTILGRLTNGSIYMSKVLFSVYCAFNSKMMIWINVVFVLIKGSISMEFIDCKDVFSLGAIGACTAWGGALDIWTLSFNNGMFKFASPLLEPWTYQTIVSYNNLENGILSSCRN